MSEIRNHLNGGQNVKNALKQSILEIDDHFTLIKGLYT